MTGAIARPAVLLCALLCALPAWAAANDARDWLARMEQAVESTSYEGTFVHMVGNQVETMHVIHRSLDGEVSERLFSRDQPGREILRNNDRVTCIFSDKRTVLVEHRKERSGAPLLSSLPGDSDDTERWYEFREAGDGRKLGRSVKVIEIRPRDAYRYGHRLWLDQITAIPLKVQLLHPEGLIVEQIQFVSMVAPAEIPDARLMPDVDTEGFQWFEQSRTPLDEADSAERPEWGVAEPPPGFSLKEAGTRQLPGSERPVEHLVYSDGLATVSVFVEPVGETDQALSGLSRMGAAHAFTLVLDERQITAVGEVPARTVERLARSVHRVGANGQ